MIVYSMICSKNHEFDQWFDNRSDFEIKRDAADISCPECSDHKVSKMLSAPKVGKAAPAPAPSCGAQACGNFSCPMQQG